MTLTIQFKLEGKNKNPSVDKRYKKRRKENISSFLLTKSSSIYFCTDLKQATSKTTV